MSKFLSLTLKKSVNDLFKPEKSSATTVIEGKTLVSNSSTVFKPWKRINTKKQKHQH